jgi:hypothetical protein
MRKQIIVKKLADFEIVLKKCSNIIILHESYLSFSFLTTMKALLSFVNGVQQRLA